MLLDTSSAVAICVSDHAAHSATVEAVGDRIAGLAGHAWFETFSVLTRLPPPLRREPAEVSMLLKVNFPATSFLTGPEQAAFVDALQSSPIAGGAIYDGLVAMAARAAGLPLLTNDRRATVTYARIGAHIEFVDVPGPERS